MSKVKRILSYVLVGAMILLASPYTANAASQQSEAINLEQAIDIATNKSIAIKLMDEKIKNAENRLSYAIKNAGIKKNDNWVTDVQRAENKREVELSPTQKRNTFELLKLQKLEKINTLKMDVTKAYFTYLLTKEQLENQEKAIERLKKRLEIVKVQVSKGIAKSSDLNNIEISLKTAEQQYSLLTRDLSNNSISLNSLIGRPIKSTIALIDQNVPIPVLNTNIDDIMNKRIVNSSQVLQARNIETEAKIEYDITNYSSIKVIPDGIEQAENKLLNASYDYKELLLNMECSVLNDYNNLLNLKDDVDIKKLQVNISEKELIIAKVEYDRGLIDIIRYNNAIQNNDDLVVTYKKAQLDYFVAAEMFKN